MNLIVLGKTMILKTTFKKVLDRLTDGISHLAHLLVDSWTN